MTRGGVAVSMDIACRVVTALLIAFPFRTVRGQEAPAGNLLPRPSETAAHADAKPFRLANPVRIVVPRGAPRLAEIGKLLATVIRLRTGYAVRVGPAMARHGAIRIDTTLASPNAEAYDIDVAEGGVVIRGATSAGALWGMQTLRQLLPPSFDDAKGPRPPSWMIPAVTVHDAPRFGWRGSMVDAGRHFFPVSVIKRHIDVLSRYKMNVFHWHLTEDQGWRIEIKRFPDLTRVGAWRTERDGSRYGGFYSQREIRDVVEYARIRGVTVVPEIEMPGHSVAALASYPELGCTGERLNVGIDWGVYTDVYCAGNEQTFTFLEQVLDEVIALFPSRYIHIGGDEVPNDRWRACPTCQELMRREGLASEDDLQRWFVGRIGAYLATRGRRLIGWNEILHGGHLLADATVQSWQDTSWTRRAVLEGHDVIASPEQWTYLNHSARDLTLERVYAFEPVPPGLDATAARRVLGGEVPLWSERIPTGATLDLMAFPRLLAFAEVMWSGAPRDFVSLERRLDTDHVPRLRALGVAVGPSNRELMELSLSYDAAARGARVRVAPAPGVTLRMSDDGRPPSATSPMVADSTLLNSDGVKRLQPFLGTQPILEERAVTVERHRALGAAVMAAVPRNRQYQGTGAWNLTDGLIGSTDQGDGLWQGWWGPDVDVIVALDSVQPIESIRVNFLQNTRSWILLPRQVEFSWSSDSVQWAPALTRSHDVPRTAEGARIQPFSVTLPPGSRARFLHIVARNAGVLPPGHPGAGSPSWLFTDEIVVR